MYAVIFAHQNLSGHIGRLQLYQKAKSKDEAIDLYKDALEHARADVVALVQYKRGQLRPDGTSPPKVKVARWHGMFPKKSTITDISCLLTLKQKGMAKS